MSCLNFSKTSNQDLEHQLQHIKGLLDAANGEKERNSEDRQRLIEKIDASGIEMQKLKSVIAELQKQQDDLNADRDDLRRDLERQLKEVERGLVYSNVSSSLSSLPLSFSS